MLSFSEITDLPTMDMLAFRWFALVYPALGLTLISGGIWILVRREGIVSWVEQVIRMEHPPALWITLVRSLFLITIPSLLFSLFPFSWTELIFSIWCLVIVYTASQMLVHWKGTAEALKADDSELANRLRFAAWNMLSIGIILLLLLYHLMSRQM